MFPRRVSSPAKTAASAATAFDHITIATVVVAAALLVGTVIGYGPKAAADHLRDVLAGLSHTSSSDLDIDVASRAMYFDIDTCPVSPFCVMR